MQHKVIVLGAGGQAKVIANIIINSNDLLLGFLDDNKEKNTNIISDYKVIGKFDDNSGTFTSKNLYDAGFRCNPENYCIYEKSAIPLTDMYYFK